MSTMNLYKIGDLCDALTITSRTIRYYDELGLLPNKKRSDGATRLFDDQDIAIIKKIRQLQQRDSLPLEHIKFKLFPKTIEERNTLIFTDSLSRDDLQLDHSVTVFVIDKQLKESQQLKNLISFIRSHKDIETFISIHSHNQLDSLFMSLKKSLPKAIDYRYFSSSSMGFGTEMIIKKAMTLLKKGPSLEELQSIINRTIHLNFNLIVLDTLSHFFTSITEANLEWSPLIQTASPILFSDQRSNRLDSFISKKQESVSILSEQFESQFIRSKRYVESLCIYHCNSSKESKALKENLLTLFPKLIITIKEKRHSQNYGASYICLSLI